MPTTDAVTDATHLIFVLKQIHLNRMMALLLPCFRFERDTEVIFR